MNTGHRYFDCFATIGPRWGMEDGERHTREHLVEDMDRCGIDAALVSTTVAAAYDPAWANKWLLEQVAPWRKRLFPMWAAIPHHADEFPGPDAFVKQARAADVRAIRIHPKTHNFSTNPESLGPLMQSLARARLPVFAHRDQFESFDALSSFIGAYSRNRIVILGLGWGEFRFAVPLLEKHKNWLMEFSVFQSNEAPEWLVRRFGAGRFLFGADAPARSPGAARAFFDWTGLRPADARAITSENLAELLGLRAAPAAAKTPDDDIIAAQWAGRPLDHITVLDSHIHVGHAGGQSIGPTTALNSGPSDMKRLFRTIGVRQAAASSFVAVSIPLPQRGNDLTYEAMRAEPDFFIGYACMDPVMMTKSEIESEIRLRHDKQGFLGLKPYVKTAHTYDDPRYNPWYQYASRRGLFALFHCSGPNATRLADAAGRVAAANRGLTAILAHSGASFAVARKNIEIALANPNALCEITYTSVANGTIELLADKIGARRILYGSDAPMRDPRAQVGWVVHARLTRQQKVDILGANFARILKKIRA